MSAKYIWDQTMWCMLHPVIGSSRLTRSDPSLRGKHTLHSWSSAGHTDLCKQNSTNEGYVARKVKDRSVSVAMDRSLRVTVYSVYYKENMILMFWPFISSRF